MGILGWLGRQFLSKNGRQPLVAPRGRGYQRDTLGRRLAEGEGAEAGWGGEGGRVAVQGTGRRTRAWGCWEPQEAAAEGSWALGLGQTTR